MLKSTKKNKEIYLDYAASALPNPSSIHKYGVEAKRNLENARMTVAKILSAHVGEIIFTSGGTESNNLAIQGMVYATEEQGFFRSSEKIPRPFKNLTLLPHIITTNIEHPSVLETCKMLKKRKLAEISIVSVESNGIVDPKKIKKAIKKNTVLVSVMYANNEIGTIQPIKEIAKEIRHYRKGRSASLEAWERDGASTRNFLTKKYPYSKEALLPVLHTDAVQGANYLDLNVEKLGVDLLSLSGSKIIGAGRVGVLYRRNSAPLPPMWGGGDQEGGLRPGTENLPAIMKFANALELAQKMKKKEVLRLAKLRDYFIKKLRKIFFFSGFPATQRQPFEKENFSQLIINGDLKNRLPNNVNITIPKIPSDLLVLELSAKGIMVSAKSACKSGEGKVSHVIKAINPSIRETDGSLRFSLGRQTTKKDIDYTLKALSQILKKLKKWYN